MMRRFPVFGILMLIPAFALVFLVGCPAPTKTKDKKDGAAVAADGKGGDKDKGKAGPLADITADTDGDLKGFVKFKGTPPDPKPLPAIAAHKDAMQCMAGEKKDMINVIDQTWIVKDGKLANVAVYLAPPAGKKFKITEALKKPFESHTVVINQPFCMYIPHVAAVYAGVQPFAVKSTAHVLHNVKIVGNKNPPTDDNLKEGEITKERKYEKETGPISISCSVHNWMNAKLLTFDHPYFAVTKEDGSFEIKNAPVGEELSVWLWHESMGAKGMEAKKLTLKKGPNTIDDLEVVSK